MGRVILQVFNMIFGIIYLFALVAHVFFGYEPSAHLVATAALIGAAYAFLAAAISV